MKTEKAKHLASEINMNVDKLLTNSLPVEDFDLLTKELWSQASQLGLTEEVGALLQEISELEFEEVFKDLEG
jgi:hypothetical protein